MKKFYKPTYKSLSNYRDNIYSNKTKIIFFQKKKWKILKDNFLNKIKRNLFVKSVKQGFYSVSTIAKRKTSYKKRYKSILESLKKFKIIYGNMKRKTLKNEILKGKKRKLIEENSKFFNIINSCERRLDVILCRARFCLNLRTARQIILHGKIFLNNASISSYSLKLKKGDIINIKEDYKKHIVKELMYNQQKNNFFSYPPENLIINYKTLQIVYTNKKNGDFFNSLNNDLNLEKVISNFPK